MSTSTNRRTILQSSAAFIAASAVSFSNVKLSKASDTTIKENTKDIPVVEKTDVLVCGGGPAGIAAAIAAARTGANVRILEMHGSLGGVWTSGLLCWILDTTSKTGLMPEISKKIRERDAGYVHPIRKSVLAYDPEVMKLMLEEWCIEEGIKLRYHTFVVGAVKNSDDKITHVITESKSGREAWAADVIIDTTGDGDVAAHAGCEFDFGREGDSKTQPMSMFALLTGIDPEATQEFYLAKDKNPGSHKALFLKEIQKSGVTPSYMKPTLFLLRDDLYVISANHEYGYSALNADDVTQATIHGRAELHKIINGLRSLGGKWKNLRIVATNEQIGIREGRRIHGHYTVSSEDLMIGARHKDGICRVHFGVDVHALSKKSDHGGGGIMRTGVRSKPYDIPLRSLIALDVHGLLMAGRNISGDFIAHSSYRVTGDSVQLGQAAGVLAAVASRENMLPHVVPWEKVETALKAFIS
jgi:hypothetical protein